MKYPIIAMTLLALSAASCGGRGAASDSSAQTDTVSPARQLRLRLDSVSRAGLVMFGHDDDPVYGHTWVGDSGRSDVLETAGDYPAVMNWDLGGIEKGDASNLDSVNFERMRAEVIAHDARGGVNAFSWHAVNPVDGQDSWQCADTTIVAQIIDNPEVAERFRNQIRLAARFIAGLTDASGKKIGVILRPWHEHTGAWFWWGSKQCTPDQYRHLWTETRRIMDEEGADNILWAYSPDRVKDIDEYLERYPGDEYVDIMGADVYHYGAEKGVDSYLAAVDATLGAATQAASEKGKLVAFTETGLEGIPMADWWTEVLLPAVSKYPAAYVVVWRNAHDKPGHFYAPWPGQESEASFKKFHDDPRTVFAREMNTIR